jgi:hypothetical protein
LTQLLLTIGERAISHPSKSHKLWLLKAEASLQQRARSFAISSVILRAEMKLLSMPVMGFLGWGAKTDQVCMRALSCKRTKLVEADWETKTQAQI